MLRAVLMTAVDEDKILSSNPCRIRGAGDERAPERPVLTVAQVFELAERVGRRPFGNVRQIPGNRYRLRFQRDGEMRTSPEVYGSRAEAVQALWKMAADGRAEDFGRSPALHKEANFPRATWPRKSGVSRTWTTRSVFEFP